MSAASTVFDVGGVGVRVSRRRGTYNNRPYEFFVAEPEPYVLPARSVGVSPRDSSGRELSPEDVASLYVSLSGERL